MTEITQTTANNYGYLRTNLCFREVSGCIRETIGSKNDNEGLFYLRGDLLVGSLLSFP